MHNARNERIKITANSLTKLSSVAIIVGFFLPLYAWLFELPVVAAVGMPILCASGLMWVTVGLILFKLALRLLRELR